MSKELIFKVGLPLIAGGRRWRPHNRVLFDESGLLIIDFWLEACYHETLAVEREPFELALAEAGGVPFVLYRAGSHPWSDVDYSFHRAAPTERPDLAGAGRLLVRLVVVEAETGLVKAVREEACDEELAGALRGMALRDAARRYTEEERGEAVGRVHRRFPSPSDLAGEANLKRVFAGGGARAGSTVVEATELAC